MVVFGCPASGHMLSPCRYKCCRSFKLGNLHSWCRSFILAKVPLLLTICVGRSQSQRDRENNKGNKVISCLILLIHITSGLLVRGGMDRPCLKKQKRSFSNNSCWLALRSPPPRFFTGSYTCIIPTIKPCSCLSIFKATPIS